MTEQDKQKAVEILQKHQPNRFPLKNNYTEAMMEFAEQYANEKVKAREQEIKELLDDDLNINQLRQTLTNSMWRRIIRTIIKQSN